MRSAAIFVLIVSPFVAATVREATQGRQGATAAGGRGLVLQAGEGERRMRRPR
jgi:hypothetical protein